MSAWRSSLGRSLRLEDAVLGGVVSAAAVNLRARLATLDDDVAPLAVACGVGRCVREQVAASEILDDALILAVERGHVAREERQAPGRRREGLELVLVDVRAQADGENGDVDFAGEP